jgi:fructose-1,6-bisphosphatase/inositol monophosphatase family enzyme
VKPVNGKREGMDIEYLIKRLSLLSAVAGRYALSVQHRVAHQSLKSQYDNVFAQALTDADLSVQGFIEVSLLAEFPEVGFFGEEESHSLNMKYFPADAPYTVYLDPIDGTRYYQDGSPLFNVILMVVHDQKIEAAVVAMPARDRYFWGIRGRGTYCANHQQVVTAPEHDIFGHPVTLNPKSDIVLSNGMPEVSLGKDWSHIDVLEAYSPGFDRCITDVLAGQARAVFGREAGLIDWGAIGFLVKEAGGVVSDLTGQALGPIDKEGDFKYPSFLAVADLSAHAQLVDELREAI